MNRLILVVLLAIASIPAPASAAPNPAPAAPPLVATGVARAAAQPKASVAQPWTLPLEVAEVYRDADTNSAVVKAVDLKIKGKVFESFVVLEGAIDIPQGEEDESMAALGPSSCESSADHLCLYHDEYVTVPLNPTPISVVQFSQVMAGGEGIDDAGHALSFGYAPVKSPAQIEAWRKLAVSGASLDCGKDFCLRVYAVGPAMGKTGVQTSQTSTQTTAPPTVRLPLRGGALDAIPSLVVCREKKVADVLGPPAECILTLANVGDDNYALSVTQIKAFHVRPVPPLAPPAEGGAEPPAPPEPLVRVDLVGLNAVWLAKQLERALAAMPWAYRAVALSESDVAAVAPFRPSHALSRWHEFGEFHLYITRNLLGYYVTVGSIDYLISFQNTERDLAEPTRVQWSLIQADIRTAVIRHLVAQCKNMIGTSCSVN